METGVLVRVCAVLASLGIVNVAAVPKITLREDCASCIFVHGLRDTTRDHQHDLVNVPCRVRFEDVEPDYY
jgi:hypothetical protein